MLTRSTRVRVPFVELLEDRTVPSGFSRVVVPPPADTTADTTSESKDAIVTTNNNNASIGNTRVDSVAPIEGGRVRITPVQPQPIDETPPRDEPPGDTGDETPPTTRQQPPQVTPTVTYPVVATTPASPTETPVEARSEATPTALGESATSLPRSLTETESVVMMAPPAQDAASDDLGVDSTQTESEPVTATTEQAVEVPALAAGMVPFNLAALDEALESFRLQLESAGQAIVEAAGGLGVTPWLATAATLLVAYEVARRRTREEAALSAEVPS